MTISEYLNGRRSATVGTLMNVSTGETGKLSIRPDVSDIGHYSIVLKESAGSQSWRMKYKGGAVLAECLADFQEYLNIDNPGAFRVA